MKYALIAALLIGTPAAAENDWNQWRGPKRDGLSPDTGLLKTWPSAGPAVVWKTAGIGGGFSTVSIQGDRIYTMGDVGDACYLIALKASDGTAVWQTRVGNKDGGGGYPGPRCTPAADGALIYAVGQFGDLICVEAATGKEVWRKSMVDFGGRTPGWGYAESPLIDGENLVCTPGGKNGTVVALKKATGEKVWQSSGFTDGAAYSSLVPTEIGGVRQYLVLTHGTIAAIAPADGKVIWRAERKGRTAVAADPVYKDGHVFVTSAYGLGCNVFKVTSEGGAFKAEEIYSDEKAAVDAKDRVANHHGGMLLVGDHLYGTNERALLCVEPKTGKVVWQNRSVGKGSVAFADGFLIVRSESAKGGQVALVEATPSGYKEAGRFSLPDPSGKNTWAHPVVFGGKLYLRNQDNLFCYDVKAK